MVYGQFTKRQTQQRRNSHRMTPSVFIDLERLRHPNVGLYNFCENLGDVMSVEKSISPTLFVPKSHVDRYTQNGARCIVRTGLHKIKSPASRQFDVVHITHQFSKYFPEKHPNTILTIHDLNFLYTGKAQKSKATLAAIQKKVDRASTIVSISDFVMDDLKKHLNLEGKKLCRIYNGVHLPNHESFDNPRYKPNAPFLFSLGVLWPKKNTHTLPCLLKDNDLELVLAGMPDESYVNQIQEEARKHGVEDRVKILGPIDEEEKYWYFKHCLAYMQPSLSEGFGLPVIEAMRFGKPLFLSDKTCLPEIGGADAFYFKNFDPENMQSVLQNGLETFAADATRKTRLIERAHLFSWEKAGAEYLKLYHQSLNV